MNRNEWLVVVALLALTVLMVAFVSPAEPVQAETPVASVVTSEATFTTTAVPSPTQVATLRPTASASPTPTTQRSATPAPSATATLSPTPSATPTATPFPFDTRADLDRYVYVDQRVQHLYVFEKGQLVRDIPCSTGLPNDDTYTEAWSGTIGEYWGTFFAFGTYQDDAWYLYKSLGSILVHSLPYTVDESGNKVYQGREALGVEPSSHGCIRLAPEDAAWFTAWNPQGAYMTITDPYREMWQ